MTRHALPGILTLTHSSRTTNLERCSPQFLVRRFDSPCRLKKLPPVDDLRRAPVLYSGAVSFLRVGGTDANPTFTPAGAIRHHDKIQHATFLPRLGDGQGEDRLLVAFEHRLEIWRLQTGGDGTFSGYTRNLRLEHPHLAGVHTVDPWIATDGQERALVSCAAADALLIANLTTGRIERTLRLPSELYGQGYPLALSHDLRHHYIPDRYQTTHVNCATLVPGSTQRRAVYSTLTQGAIGLCDLERGTWCEITRGFVGCHGARANAAGTLYFTDSTTGTLVFLNLAGQITYRYAVPSRWLHDALPITDRLWAFALADRNELRIYDLDEDRLAYRQPFPLRQDLHPEDAGLWLGDSTQALAWCHPS
jgi:hypothetical protein